MNIKIQTFMDEGWRECTKCWKYKIWDCFYLSAGAMNWHMSRCKACYTEYNTSKERKKYMMTNKNILDVEKNYKSKENKIMWQRHSSKKYEKKVDKMTTSHKYPEEKPYWNTDNTIEIGTKPIPALYNYIK